MKTLYLPASDPNTCDVAAKILREGGLVAIPTETVYGLGANGLDEAAVAKIFIAKGRPQDNPLILHVADAIQMEDFAHDIPAEAYLLAEKFWPGPLTMILTAKDIVPRSTTASILPSWSWSTCWAVTVEGLPEVLAEGAATGTPARRMISLVVSLSGQRMPTVVRPPVVDRGTMSLAGRIRVRGPGQNFSASR